MAGSPTHSDRRERALRALQSPRGRYNADRASQLSGIPVRTIYDWRSSDVLAPDFSAATPIAWSYRDLVYLRLLAWLRQRGMRRDQAAGRVAGIRNALAAGESIRRIRTDGRITLLNDERSSRFGGENVLPLEELFDAMGEFDLTAPIAEIGTGPLWGPDLIQPSTHTYISPWVMAGEPCVEHSRVPTVSLYALREQRGLTPEAVVQLYPGLKPEAVEDAWHLEELLAA